MPIERQGNFMDAEGEGWYRSCFSSLDDIPAGGIYTHGMTPQRPDRKGLPPVLMDENTYYTSGQAGIDHWTRPNQDQNSASAVIRAGYCRTLRGSNLQAAKKILVCDDQLKGIRAAIRKRKMSMADVQVIVRLHSYDGMKGRLTGEMGWLPEELERICEHLNLEVPRV